MRSLEIHDEKIRAIIAAGIRGKVTDPRTDLTSLSYRRIEKYIISLEEKVIESGDSLPTVV